jgi:hypothetical protein
MAAALPPPPPPPPPLSAEGLKLSVVRNVMAWVEDTTQQREKLSEFEKTPKDIDKEIISDIEMWYDMQIADGDAIDRGWANRYGFVERGQPGYNSWLACMQKAIFGDGMSIQDDDFFESIVGNLRGVSDNVEAQHAIGSATNVMHMMAFVKLRLTTDYGHPSYLYGMLCKVVDNLSDLYYLYAFFRAKNLMHRCNFSNPAQHFVDEGVEMPSFVDTDAYDPSMDFEPCNCRINMDIRGRCMPLSEPLYERNFTELAWHTTDEGNWVNCPCRVDTLKQLFADTQSIDNRDAWELAGALCELDSDEIKGLLQSYDEEGEEEGEEEDG